MKFIPIKELEREMGGGELPWNNEATRPV